MLGPVNLVGQRIGSYVVQKELGAGGTGTVYLCQHTLIERAVAVKVLHEEQARDPDQVARFFQEAKAAAEIGHPNIIGIIDFGHLEHLPGRPPYLMMEALEGMSLDKRMRQGGLDLDDVNHIMRQVCSALVASHGKGIIHRDLKPPNVFLCDRSFDPLFVKVLDFGTAKLTVPTLDGTKTMVGMVLGTPAYMSPEQCDGKGVIDHRSDVYSLGIMLYEMLTGTMPFDGEVGELLIHQLFHEPAPPRARNPAIPVEWEALCLRMMEKLRDNRFQSVSDLANALEDLQGHAAAYATFRTSRAQGTTSGHTMIAPAEDLGGPSDGVVERAVGRTNDSRVTVHGSLEEFSTRARAAGPATSGYTSAPLTDAHAAAASGAHLSPTPTGAHVPYHPSGAYAALPPSSGGFPPVASTPAPMPSGAYAALSGPYPQPPMPPPDPLIACSALINDPRYQGFTRTLMIRPGGRWYDLFEVCRTGGVAPPPTLALELSLFVTWVEHPYPDPSLAAVVFLALRTGWSTVLLCPRAHW